jgi:hypothetical protein
MPHFPQICKFPLDNVLGGRKADMVQSVVTLQEISRNLFGIGDHYIVYGGKDGLEL